MKRLQEAICICSVRAAQPRDLIQSARSCRFYLVIGLCASPSNTAANYRRQ